MDFLEVPFQPANDGAIECEQGRFSEYYDMGELRGIYCRQDACGPRARNTPWERQRKDRQQKQLVMG